MLATHCHSRISHQVAKGIAHGKDCKAQNGIRDAKDVPERLYEYGSISVDTRKTSGGGLADL